MTPRSREDRSDVRAQGLQSRRREGPQELERAGLCRQGRIREALRRRASRSPTSSGASRASASTGSSPIRASRTPRSNIPTSRSNGSRTARSTSRPTASTGISRSAASRPRSSGSPTIRTSRCQAHHLSRAARECLQVRQCAEGARRQARRPRHDLPADDPGSGLRHARLRAHRRDPFRRVRRLLAGLARGPHRGLQVVLRHHRRRGLARRPQGPAEGEYRRSHRRKWPGWTKVLVVRRTGGEGAMDARPRSLARRRARQGRAPTARRRRWTRRTRCLFSTRPARRESPRACCTRRAAISSSPR